MNAIANNNKLGSYVLYGFAFVLYAGISSLNGVLLANGKPFYIAVAGGSLLTTLVVGKAKPTVINLCIGLLCFAGATYYLQQPGHDVIIVSMAWLIGALFLLKAMVPKK